MGSGRGERWFDADALVSVVVSTRDRGAMVRATVESVLANDWPQLELVVVDQSCDDRSWTALADLCRDPRVRYVRSTTVGLSTSRNVGLREACSDLIVMTDDDCLVPPHFVRTMVEELTSDPAVALVFADVNEVVADDGMWTPANRATRDYTVSRLREWRSNDGVNVGIGAAMAVRRSAILRLGGFDEELGSGARFRSGEDTDLALRAVLRHQRIRRTTRTWTDHYGARDLADGRDVVRGAMFGVSAACGKLIRLRQWSIVPFFVGVCWRMVVVAAFAQIVRFRRPRVLGRATYLARGVVAGLRQPADPLTLRFQPPSAEPVVPAPTAWFARQYGAD